MRQRPRLIDAPAPWAPTVEEYQDEGINEDENPRAPNQGHAPKRPGHRFRLPKIASHTGPPPKTLLRLKKAVHNLPPRALPVKEVECHTPIQNMQTVPRGGTPTPALKMRRVSHTLPSRKMHASHLPSNADKYPDREELERILTIVRKGKDYRQRLERIQEEDEMYAKGISPRMSPVLEEQERIEKQLRIERLSRKFGDKLNQVKKGDEAEEPLQVVPSKKQHGWLNFGFIMDRMCCATQPKQNDVPTCIVTSRESWSLRAGSSLCPTME